MTRKQEQIDVFFNTLSDLVENNKYDMINTTMAKIDLYHGPMEIIIGTLVITDKIKDKLHYRKLYLNNLRNRLILDHTENQINKLLHGF